MIVAARQAALAALVLGFCVHASAGGAKQLFDGKDLDGWAFLANHEGPGFIVENGELQTRGGSGMLWYTREEIGNSVIRVRLQDVQ